MRLGRDKGEAADPEGLLPPHDIDAEEHVLGAMLLSPVATNAVETILQAQHFYRDSHRVLYRVLVEMVEANVPTDLVSVAAELEDRGIDTPDRARIAELGQLVPSVSNVRRYAQIVRDRARARDDLRAAQSLIEAARTGNVRDHPDALDQVRRMLDRPVDADQALRPLNLTELLFGTPPPVPWILEGWIARGDLAMIIAHPGAGKSLLSLLLAIRARTADPAGLVLGETVTKIENAGYIDLENPKVEAHARLAAYGLTSTNHDGLHYFTWEGVGDFTISTPDGRARLEATVATYNLDLVVIDSFRRAAPGVDENDSGAISAILTPLRSISARHDCSIIVIHHARKKARDGTDDAIEMIRGSSDIGASLDQLLYLRTKPGDPASLILEHGKSRRGIPHSAVQLRIERSDRDDGTYSLDLVNEGDAAAEHGKIEHVLSKILRALDDDGGLVPTSVLALKVGEPRNGRHFKDALTAGYNRSQLAKTEGQAYITGGKKTTLWTLYRNTLVDITQEDT
ncbi:MAG: hypothetical protein FJ033_16100 [Chloroflexi bacterium]|nr:hypothetical protein [Chloroflexota bacterium]